MPYLPQVSLASPPNRLKWLYVAFTRTGFTWKVWPRHNVRLPRILWYCHCSIRFHGQQTYSFIWAGDAEFTDNGDHRSMGILLFISHLCVVNSNSIYAWSCASMGVYRPIWRLYFSKTLLQTVCTKTWLDKALSKLCWDINNNLHP